MAEECSSLELDFRARKVSVIKDDETVPDPLESSESSVYNQHCESTETKNDPARVDVASPNPCLHFEKAVNKGNRQTCTKEAFMRDITPVSHAEKLHNRI